MAQRKAENTPSIIIFLIIAAMTGANALWAYSNYRNQLALQEFTEALDQLTLEMNRPENQPGAIVSRAFKRRTTERAPGKSHPPKAEIEKSPAKPARVTPKQNIFNDQNYTPKGATNSIKPPPSRYYEPGEARTKAQVREINQGFKEGIQQITDKTLRSDQNRQKP